MNVRVDYRSSLSLVGTVVKYLSVPLAIPIAVALVYGESVLPFVATIAVAVALGTAMERLHSDPDLGHREGFLMVGLTWLLVPIVGCIPYLVAGHGTPSTVAHPVNALFESMSGFTTTGATVLGEISFERHSRSLLMWRQITQWLGGMGIVVLMVAILPELSVGGAQLVQAEAPGVSLEKLTPRIRETARALWKIYIAFTIVAAGVYYSLYLLGLDDGMTLYQAIAHAFTTMPTGGFSPEARSLEAFSGWVQWASMPFMIAAGTNFALFWHVLRGNPDRLVGNKEFRSYLAMLALLAAILAGLLYAGFGLDEIPVIGDLGGDLEASARHALFQAAAIVTTTGYASMDFNTWSQPAQAALLLAMFLGGSAGSAAGSIKIVRWYMIQRSMRRELYTTVHPEAIRPIRMDGDVVDEETLRGLFVFVVVFLSLFGVSTLLLLLDGIRNPELDLSLLEAASAAVATLGNIGPGFGAVGPMNSYLAFSNPAKLYMIFLMWIGRLEILSVLVILTPSYWR